MTAVVLLNGPPAAGKSTIAAQLVDQRPLALNLDIDTVRGHLGRWIDAPVDAGLAARALAIAMIDTHLAAGHPVVVPQLLVRPDFIDELSDAAARARVAFVEIVLDLDRAAAHAAFDERRASNEPNHIDAAELLDRSADPAPLGDLLSALDTLIASRSHVRRVPVRRGDIDGTLAAVLTALEDYGIDW